MQILFGEKKLSLSLYLWVYSNAKISTQSGFWEVGDRNLRN